MSISELQKEYQKKWRLENKEYCREYNKKWRADNREYYNAYYRVNRKDIHRRKELLRILGNKCSNPDCLVLGGCTDIRCLQLDHINGGGLKEMREFKSNMKMYGYYLNHIDDAKRKLQVLCANCNWIKRYENNECIVLSN